MVFLDLVVQVATENIEEIYIEDKTFRWYLEISCSNCSEKCENEIYFTELDEAELSGSRGIANFVYTCKLCKRQSSISLYKDSQKHITCKNNKGEAVLAIFDCRGLDITKWDPKDQFAVMATESGAKFKQADLSDLPWCEYDEATQNSVQIEAIQHKIERNKSLK